MKVRSEGASGWKFFSVPRRCCSAWSTQAGRGGVVEEVRGQPRGRGPSVHPIALAVAGYRGVNRHAETAIPCRGGAVDQLTVERTLAPGEHVEPPARAGRGIGHLLKRVGGVAGHDRQKTLPGRYRRRRPLPIWMHQTHQAGRGEDDRQAQADARRTHRRGCGPRRRSEFAARIAGVRTDGGWPARSPRPPRRRQRSRTVASADAVSQPSETPRRSPVPSRSLPSVPVGVGRSPGMDRAPGLVVLTRQRAQTLVQHVNDLRWRAADVRSAKR